ncbi:hypothetical protein [Lysobacter gummosus]|uniref:hypothetical protein n=1 Tax=Lysobacter gummosus TaxID=262324 RepID=UPI0036387766
MRTRSASPHSTPEAQSQNLRLTVRKSRQEIERCLTRFATERRACRMKPSCSRCLRLSAMEYRTRTERGRSESLTERYGSAASRPDIAQACPRMDPHRPSKTHCARLRRSISSTTKSNSKKRRNAK